MRAVQHSYERPLTRDVLASAFKVPFKLHGIKTAPSIMLVNRSGVEDMMKFCCEPLEEIPDSFIVGANTLVLTVPDYRLYNVIIFLIPSY